VVFHTTDTICRAMEDGKKIRFHYWNYNPQKEHILRHDGEWFIASPYALIWDDERYYLAAYSDFREKVVTFRVDRMCDVEITEEAAVRDDSFNTGEFAKTTFKMIDEDYPDSKVILICDNQFMQNVVDRFGEEIETTVLDDSTFRASVTVRPSKTFFSWVVGFCGGIRIAEPADVKERFEETLRMVLSCQSAI
jgi:predicted DNA-binding transcriptional regulator YafY